MISDERLPEIMEEIRLCRKIHAAIDFASPQTRALIARILDGGEQATRAIADLAEWLGDVMPVSDEFMKTKSVFLTLAGTP